MPLEPVQSLAEGRIAALALPKKYSRTYVYAAFFLAIPPCAVTCRMQEMLETQEQFLALP